MKERRLFVGWVISIIIIIGIWYITDDSSFQYINEIFTSENESSDTSSGEGSNSTPIDEISSGMIGERVIISGEIISRYEHENGHLFLTLWDESGKIDVPIFEGSDIDLDELKNYDYFTITGEVGEYEGDLQLVPGKQTDIVRR